MIDRFIDVETDVGDVGDVEDAKDAGGAVAGFAKLLGTVAGEPMVV